MNRNDPRPMATYRLQFNHEFRFTHAQSLVPYFSRLGVSHVYASPILRARQASTHGYDVVDPATINPNLGDKTDLINLVHALHNYGLGSIVDIVPNHMAASIENPYWRDVLTYGPSSPFARWFDIDWRMPDREMWGRVLVPVLGQPSLRVIERDQFRVEWSEGRFLVRYFEHIFPVDPATVPSICQFGMETLDQQLGSEHPVVGQMRDILNRLGRLPKLAFRLRRRVEIDREETEQWLAEFARLVVQSPQIQQWAEETAAGFGEGEEGRGRLRKLLAAQPYRLVHWRDAARAMNYRRFFDINELVSIRQEDPQVFDDTHATIRRWAEDGLIDGLRIDHVDGLRDPLGYLDRLAESTAAVRQRGRPFPVFVEKILAPEEKLPCGWPVEGTTGYEFLNQAEAIFVSPEGFAELEEQYRRMMRRPVRFAHVAAWGKRRVLRNDLSPHVGRLADILLRLAEKQCQEPFLSGVSSHVRHGTAEKVPDTSFGPLVAERQELTKRDLVDAIVEVVVALPVYRTYVDSNQCTVSDADRQYVEAALAGARHSGRAAPEAIDFLGQVLRLDNKSQLPDHELSDRVNFIQRFQQLTGPAAAKGIEDTALYAYLPLVSLNEVGGQPHLPAGGAACSLHQANDQRAATRPRTLLCVTTHDTKRTADVRARLDVLSELPKLWFGLVRRWQRLNRPHRTLIHGKRAPDAAAEYLFYQTVVGLWPAPHPHTPHELPDADVLKDLRERIEGYMLKAVREAKTHTSWTNNNRPYEDGVVAFVRSLLLPGGSGPAPFLSDVQNLVLRIARPGFWNSLSRTLIQFTAPGTPDLYQGDELWNFALVDPDNRRAVDYRCRQRLLDEVITGIESPDELRCAFVRSLVESPEDGRIKLHVIRSALNVRRERPGLFADGDYLPLATDGPARDHLFAFARQSHRSPSSAQAERWPPDTLGERSSSDQAAVIVVPRLTTVLVNDSTAPPLGHEVWTETVIRLPEAWQDRNWTNVLTREQVSPASRETLPVGKVLQSFPVALLVTGSTST